VLVIPAPYDLEDCEFKASLGQVGETVSQKQNANKRTGHGSSSRTLTKHWFNPHYGKGKKKKKKTL
jgi:hypothetical protein